MKLPNWLADLLNGSVEDRLDALRAEEASMKRHIQHMRRKHMAIVEERQALEAQILQGVRL